jgi:hypothetical protein
MSLEDLQSQFESPPTSTQGSSGGSGQDQVKSWEPNNIICAGSNNQIINGRRCSIINGSGNTIGGGATNDSLLVKRNLGKFNTHILGRNNLIQNAQNDNIQDNTFYVGTDLKIDTNEANWECYVHRSLYADGDVIAYYSSDARLKDNVIKISDRDAKDLRPVSFKWKKDGSEDIGLIAQQVKNVFPEAVVQREDGSLGVQYHKLAIALILSIQKKQKKINKLKTQINKLK